jgi:hypothetical protein
MVAIMPEDQTVPDQGLAQEVLGDMAGMLNDTRHSMFMGGGILAGLAVGIAVEAAFAQSPLGTGIARAVGVTLLVALIICWLRSAGLLFLAGRPILGIVSNHRWQAGAPLDPRPRWLNLPPIEATPQEWTWVRAHLLLGAARIRMTRVQSALTWTFVTAALFLAWTAVIIVNI